MNFFPKRSHASCGISWKVVKTATNQGSDWDPPGRNGKTVIQQCL